MANRTRPAVSSLANDPAFIRSLRNLCPSGKDGLTAVTLEIPGGPSVTLTPESRKKFDRMLKGRKA